MELEKEAVVVGEGLRQVFLGELLTVVSLVAVDVGRGLQITPLLWLGGLVGVVSMVMVMIGLVAAATARRGYRNALLCVAAELVLSVASVLLPDPGKALLAVPTALAAAIGVWLICTNTSALLLEMGGEEDPPLWGGVVWKVYALVGVLSAVAYAVFVYSPWLPAARFPVMLAAPLLQLAALLLYLRFLDKSRQLLRRK